MSEPDETVSIARARLADVVEHLRFLASDVDFQNAWLHPCGWTRAEPFVHAEPHRPCVPISELWQSLDDMWPGWRATLQPVLTPSLAEALDQLSDAFKTMDEPAWVDELNTLDCPEWTQVRRLAHRALEAAQPIVSAM